MNSKYDRYRFRAIMADSSQSALNKYQDLVLSSRSLTELIKYEIITCLVGTLPGAAGLVLRCWLYPKLFEKAGKGCVFGTHITLRSSKNIWIGKRVVVDDYVVLSHRGDSGERIEIEDGVLIGRGAEVKTRAGSISIRSNANIGPHCRITSTSKVDIGRYCLFAARCSVGGVSHRIDRTDIPIVHQPLDDKGGVIIRDDVWLGTHVVVNDGITIGTGAVIGAGAVVTKDIPAYAVAVGVPAKVISYRNRE